MEAKAMPRAFVAAVALLLLPLLAEPARGDGPRQKADNVLIVTLDGFRWQEVFAGADEALLDARAGGVRDVAALKRSYWRAQAARRREVLLPFLWGTVARRGQLFGNPARK